MEKPVIITYQGKNMIGMLHIPDTMDVKPWVVTIHGFADTKVEQHRMFVKIARRLAKHGIGVLRVDLLGSGDSEGDFEDMTVLGEIEQTLAVIEWLRSQPELKVSDIGLLGYSLGGCVSACAAARDGRIKTLVLWAPVATPQYDMMNYFGLENVYRALSGAVVCAPDGDAVNSLFFEGLDKINPIEEISNMDQPILLVQGTMDQAIVPFNAHRYKSCFRNEQSRVHYIEGAGHRFDTLEHESELLNVTEKWFLEHMGHR